MNRVTFVVAIGVMSVIMLCSVMTLVKEGFAAPEFTIDSKTSAQAKDPIKLKVIASANGETKAKKTSTISNPNLGTIEIPFHFKKENDIVTAGHNDEYFVCGYILDSKTGYMTSYVCNEGDLLNPDGENPATLNSFLTVPEGQNPGSKDVKINILIPLSDRPDVHKIKVVAMVKGEFQSKIINAEEAHGKTQSVMFNFDRDTDIGKIQIGDEYFTCVSSNDFNPPEGTECEKRHIKSIDELNVLVAR